MTNEAMDRARAIFFTAHGLDEAAIERTLNEMSTENQSFTDLYFQSAHYESWALEEKLVKGGHFSINQGVGLRNVCGEQTAFAYSDDLSPNAIVDAARSVHRVAFSQLGSKNRRFCVSAKSPGIRPQILPQHLYATDSPLQSMSEAEKVDLLKQMDAWAREASPYVQQVSTSLSLLDETILVIDDQGRMSADVRPLMRVNFSVIVHRDGKTESGNAGGGGRFTLRSFEPEQYKNYATSAVTQALTNLDAVAAPAGKSTVVLGSGWPGILLHEAVGHGLESDFNRKGTSVFSNRIGEQVAARGVTVIDDGSINDRRGSLNIDDEGVATQRTVLIEDGILKGYLMDKQNAFLMGEKSTGNGRRESYAHLPMPRMTNTYMLNGEHTPKAIIQSVEDGVYAVNFSGGQVDITSGKFVFTASEAYRIQNGEITHPLKNATLIGNGPEVMKQISMIGNDMQLDSGVGVCGKEGQSVPVGVGQPTLKVEALTVGGTGMAEA